MKRSLAAAVLAAGTLTSAAQAQELYIGQVITGGWNFCPRGTAPLDGQLLSINENQTLYSLLGTTFGGDGRTTFALPDQRGRASLHPGQGPGLTSRALGQKIGSETNTLTTGQMPSHTHDVSAQMNGTNTPASAPTPAGNLPALTTTGPSYGTVPAGGAVAAMASNAISVMQTNQGGNQPINNMQPSFVMMHCIVMQGIYPSRN